MKLSKKERKLLKREIQQGFMQTWLSQSRGKKENRSELQKVKSRASRWLAFCKRPVQSLKPIAPIIVAKAAGSDE
jgi:hypothetical protein